MTLEMIRRIVIVIGIILSIVWMGYGVVQESERMRRHSRLVAEEAVKACSRRNTPGENCADTMVIAYLEAEARQQDDSVTNALRLLPYLFVVALAWAIAYGAVAAIRWVLDARQP